MKKITLFIFLFALLLLRPSHLQYYGMMYPGDDYDYLAHSTALVYGEFPFYDKEYHFGEQRPLGSIGPGLMAAPFVLGFSLFDRMAGSPITEQRSPGSLRNSWTQFGFIFATQFYFWLACFFLFQGIKKFIDESFAANAIILMVLCQGIPLFVFRRPLFSHAFEFFLQSVMVFFLCLSGAEQKFSLQRPRNALLLGFLLSLMVLVRLNNLFAAMAWPVVLMLNQNIDPRKRTFWKTVGLIGIAFLLSIAAFKIWPDVANPAAGYQKYLKELLLVWESPDFYIKRLAHILFAVDWGLLYAAPLLFVGLTACFRLKLPLKKEILICLMPMAVNLYITMMWKTQGGWYGYRYLIPSLAPLLVLPFAFYLKRLDEKRAWLKILSGALVLFPLVSMLSFEGHFHKLNLHVIEQYFGLKGWGHNTYQFSAWKMFLFDFGNWVNIPYKAGIQYFVYLAAKLMTHWGWMPEQMFREYPSFKWTALVKYFILIGLPLLLLSVVGARHAVPLRRKFSVFTIPATIFTGCIFILLAYVINKPFIDPSKVTPENPRQALGFYQLRKFDIRFIIQSWIDGRRLNRRLVNNEYLRYYEKLIEHFPNKADAYGMIGYFKNQLGQVDEALKAYEKSVEINPNFFWTRFNLGVLYYQQGDYPSASRHLQTALRLDPDQTIAAIEVSKNVYRPIAVMSVGHVQGMRNQLNWGRRRAFGLLALSQNRIKGSLRIKPKDLEKIRDQVKDVKVMIY